MTNAKEHRCLLPTAMTFAKKRDSAVKRGERKTDVSRMLNISRNTLDLWLKREEQTGDCQAITQYQQGCRHKISDLERFREFVQQHGDKTQGQMARVVGRQRDSAKHQ